MENKGKFKLLCEVKIETAVDMNEESNQFDVDDGNSLTREDDPTISSLFHWREEVVGKNG